MIDNSWFSIHTYIYRWGIWKQLFLTTNVYQCVCIPFRRVERGRKFSSCTYTFTSFSTLFPALSHLSGTDRRHRRKNNKSSLWPRCPCNGHRRPFRCQSLLLGRTTAGRTWRRTAAVRGTYNGTELEKIGFLESVFGRLLSRPSAGYRVDLGPTIESTLGRL